MFSDVLKVLDICDVLINQYYCCSSIRPRGEASETKLRTNTGKADGPIHHGGRRGNVLLIMYTVLCTYNPMIVFVPKYIKAISCIWDNSNTSRQISLKMGLYDKQLSIKIKSKYLLHSVK